MLLNPLDPMYRYIADDPDLNIPFTIQEITKAIKKLKSHKSSGIDQIINEFFKHSPDKLIPVYAKLFNIILYTGIVPDDWAISIIRPIYKNKGDDTDPNNYRGISLLSCFGKLGGGPRVVVSTAAFHARVRGSVPGLGGLKETKLFLPHPRVKVSIVGSLRDREVACSASDRQGSNFKSCVWRTVSSQSSHHPQEVLLAQFSLYVHKGGLKPDSFHFIFASVSCSQAV